MAWLVARVSATAIASGPCPTSAYRLHSPVPTQYDRPTALLAFLNAFFATFVALVVVTQAS